MKVLPALAIMIMLSTGVLAQATDDAQLQTNAGLRPSNILYFLDIAIERLEINSAKTDNDRARIALEHAAEHLAEAQLEARDKNIVAKDRAIEEHNKALDDAAKAAPGLSEEHRAKVEAMISKHLAVLQAVKAKLGESAGVDNALAKSGRVLEKARTRVMADGRTTTVPQALGNPNRGN